MSTPQAVFTQPMLHVLDATKLRVMWSERHNSTRWFGDGEVIHKGDQQYRVMRQQPEVHNYYVWVIELVDGAMPKVAA